MATEEQIAEAIEAFSLFDKDSAGSIRTNDLGLVLRSLGFTISTSELELMEKDADSADLGFVKQPDFLRQLNTAVHLSAASNLNTKKALVGLGESVSQLLTHEGADEIPVITLKHLLTRMGDRMSVEEFSELCKSLQIKDGKVKIEDLISLFKI